HDAVHREQPVVDVGGDEIALRGGELQANQSRRGAADKEEHRDAGEIEDGNAFVVGGEEPRTQPIVLGEIIFRLLAHRCDLVSAAKDLMYATSRTRSSSPILPANDTASPARNRRRSPIPPPPPTPRSHP